MSLTVPGLKVTIDADYHEEMEVSQLEPETDVIYCACQSEYCDCGSSLGVTEASARKIYKHLGFNDGRKALSTEGYRENALHIWGTHNLSTEDVLSWVAGYNPSNIEWINDASCNIVFSSANTVLRVMVDSAEPFDRRVALAAAAALASFIESKETMELDAQGQQTQASSPGADTEANLSGAGEADSPGAMTANRSLHVSTEALDSIEEFSQYLPPTGRWYKALSVPSKAISLFLRFAHKSDVKLPGAERRSLYYRRYGNPNYGGMTGILSRSYRRRLKLFRHQSGADADGNVRHVRVLPRDFAEAIADAYDYSDLIEVPRRMRNKATNSFASNFTNPELLVSSAPERSLIVYDNLYETDDRKPAAIGGRSDSWRNGLKVNPGQRREAIDFPTPSVQRHPRKWPRRDRGPPPNRWLTDDYRFSPPDVDNIRVVDLREPWAVQASPLHEPFVFSGNKHTHRRIGDDADPLHLDSFAAVPDGTTITLMPDIDPIEPNEDEHAYRARRLLASMSMVADMEEHTSKQRSLSGRLGFPNGRNSGSSGGRRSTHDSCRRNRDVWQRLG